MATDSASVTMSLLETKPEFCASVVLGATPKQFLQRPSMLARLLSFALASSPHCWGCKVSIDMEYALLKIST